jgi:CMP-N-acetylneuraminic acid synthetase
MEIAEVATRFGAEIPFFRPPELANDFATTVPVIAHAIQECEKLGLHPDFVCCIYPCVPFLNGADLAFGRSAIEGFVDGYCYPVTEFPSPIQRALRLSADGRLQPVQPEHEWTRTQDLETFYHDAGQFYWGRRQSWLTGLGLQSHGHGVVVPQWRVVDIDTPDDWRRAELLFMSRGEADGGSGKLLQP